MRLNLSTLGILALAAQSLTASTVVYTDRAAFLAQLTSPTNIDFTGSPFTQEYAGAGLTVSGINMLGTFELDSSCSHCQTAYWTAYPSWNPGPGAGSDWLTAGASYIELTYPAGDGFGWATFSPQINTYSFGFDYYAPDSHWYPYAGRPAADFTVTLSDGTTHQGSHDRTAISFLGFISTTPITSVRVDYTRIVPNAAADGFTSTRLLYNNIVFEPAPEVPEPASFALVGVGLAALRLVRPRRRRS